MAQERWCHEIDDPKGVVGHVKDAYGTPLARQPFDERGEGNHTMGVDEVERREVEVEIEVGDGDRVGHELEITPGDDIDVADDRDDDPVAMRPHANVVTAITPATTCHAYERSRRAWRIERGPTSQ